MAGRITSPVAKSGNHYRQLVGRERLFDAAYDAGVGRPSMSRTVSRRASSGRLKAPSRLVVTVLGHLEKPSAATIQFSLFGPETSHN